MIEKEAHGWTLSTRDGDHEFSKIRAKQNWEKFHNSGDDEKKELRDRINQLFGSDEKLKKQLFPTLY